jgi:hypothetical protein
MTDSVYGPLVLATDVEDAATLTLQTWLPQYLAMVSRKIGQTADWLQPPKSYVVSNDAAHWPEDQIPAVVIGSSGTTGKPKRDARLYRAMWQLQVVVYCSANDRPSTERLAKYYGGAVRATLAQKASLGNFAAGAEWEGEKYDFRIAERDKRTLGSCSNIFCVDVRDVVQALGGPALVAPPTTVPPDWPVANNVTVTLDPEAPH